MPRKDRSDLYKSMGFLSSLGISMVLCTMIGFGMGYYLDETFNTSPWMKILFLVLGIVAGFRNIFILTNRELKRQQETDDRD